MQRGPAERRIVRLRLQTGATTTFDSNEMKDSMTGNCPTGAIVKLPMAVIPAKMKCTECGADKTPKDMWWCRTCLKTICMQCNLMKGHTEHRSSQWSTQEIAQSFVNSVEQRRAVRFQRAADEKIAIREYMVEVENYFLTKLNNISQERNEEDRALMLGVCESLGYDARTALPNVDATPPTQSLLPLHGLEDGKLERIVQEVRKLLTVSDASVLLNASFASSSRPSTPVSGTVSSSKRRSMRILPEMTAEDFARMLEEKMADDVWSKRARANSIDLVLRSGTPIEVVYDSSPLSSTSTTEHQMLMQNGSSPLPPVEPKVTVVNGSQFNRSTTNGLRSSDRFKRDRISPHHAYPEDFEDSMNTTKSSIQMMVSEDTQTGGSVLTSATQTEEVQVQADSAVASSENGTSSSTANSPTMVANSLLVKTTHADRTSLHGADNMSSVSAASEKLNVTAFFFGQDYLTRPIDVRVLEAPLNRLAVSDSCGGVYITSRDGDVIHQIWTEGGSASSLYVSMSRKELLISVMKKQGRTIQIHNAANYELIESLPCPTEPDVDLTRSRWLATSKRGEIYVVSGDNRVSALWKYSRSSKSWITLKVSKGTRYQYLTYVDEQPSDHTLTLLTCEGVNGALILFTIRQNRLIGEHAFNKMYRLNDYIRSPASAAHDEAGNLLILDYANGKVWLLTAPKNGKDRHLKVLMEVGAQEGMGLAAAEGWCYVACLNKKRIQAIKYLDV